MDDEDVPLPNSLLTLLNDGTLTLSEFSEKILIMTKKREIQNKYRNQIKTRNNDGRFYIYIKRKQITAPTQKELIDKLYEMEYGRATSSLADLFPEWMIWRRDCTAVTDKTLRMDVNSWKQYLQDEPLTQISLTELQPKDFIRLFRKWTKDRQMTRKQFNNVKSLINGIYYYAIEDGIVEHNPIKDVNSKQFPFKPVNNNDDVFTVADRKKLLEHLANNDDMYSLAIQLDFQLVCRIGELLSLRWTDISNGNIHIQSQLVTERTMNDDLTFSKRTHVNVDHVKGNTDKGYRFQPLTDEAVKILKKIKELNPDGEFVLMKNGRQLNANTFNRWLKRYCEECKIPVRSSHKIRFCVASMLYDAGIPLTVLQQLLGHTTTAMTLHYLRQVTPTKDTINLINSALC